MLILPEFDKARRTVSKTRWALQVATKSKQLSKANTLFLKDNIEQHKVSWKHNKLENNNAENDAKEVVNEVSDRMEKSKHDK